MRDGAFFVSDLKELKDACLLEYSPGSLRMSLYEASPSQTYKEHLGDLYYWDPVWTFYWEGSIKHNLCFDDDELIRFLNLEEHFEVGTLLVEVEDAS